MGSVTSEYSDNDNDNDGLYDDVKRSSNLVLTLSCDWDSEDMDLEENQMIDCFNNKSILYYIFLALVTII